MVALSLAQKNVTRKQERSFLTIVGVILAVGSFVALLSLAEGLHHKLYREVYGRNVDIYILPHTTIPLPTGPIGALGYSSDVIFLMQPVKPAKGEAKQPSPEPTGDQEQPVPEVKVENILAWLNPTDENSDSNIKKAIGITRFQENLGGKMIIIWGIPFEDTALDEQNFLKTFFPSFSVADGVLPVISKAAEDPYCLNGSRKLADLTDEDRRLIVGERLAQEIKLHVGKTFAVKRGKDSVKLSVECIGRFNTGLQDYFCFIPIETALSIEDAPGKVKEIWVQVKNKAKVRETRKLIQSTFPDVSVKTSEEYLGASSELVKYAWLLQFAIALIGILIATTASMNTMLMSTFERIKEFGAMRAIGTSRFTIIIMVLIESLILSLTGGIFGIIIGLLGSRFLDGAVMAIFKASFPIAHITLNLVLYALLLSFFIGIVGAIIPAVIIYRMDIIRSLKWE